MQDSNNPVRKTLYAWAERNNIIKVQTTAAEKLGVTRGAISWWLKHGYVSDKHLIAYAELVGCSPYEVSGTAHVLRAN